MRALDLFSGIGGIALAAEWAGIETVAFCEIEPYCRRVLARHWPGVPIYEDVRELTRERLERDGVIGDGRSIGLVCGGLPCQPFSVAGKQRGINDDRHLWPEMYRIVRELRPPWVLIENVTGFVNLALDHVLDDLENESYETRTFIIPALAVGAPHRRDRVFVVAHASCQLPHGSGGSRRRGAEPSDGGQDVADTQSQGSPVGRAPVRHSKKDAGLEHIGEGVVKRAGPAQSRMGRGAHGLPDWLDGTRWPAAFGMPQYEWEPPRVAVGVKNRVPRLKALGNAVVPQQVYPILLAIRQAHERRREG